MSRVKDIPENQWYAYINVNFDHMYIPQKDTFKRKTETLSENTVGSLEKEGHLIIAVI